METRSIVRMKIFTFKDVLRFATIPLIADTIFVYFGVNAAKDFQQTALLVVVGLTFWLPYITVLKTRRDWIKSVAFVTKQGIPIIKNEFDVKQEDVEMIIDETVKAWDEVLKKNSLEVISTLFVEFKPFPVHHWRDPKKALAGMLIGKKAVVGYKPNLNSTALSHELGHEIHYDHIGYYDAEVCHAFMKEHKLR